MKKILYGIAFLLTVIVILTACELSDVPLSHGTADGSTESDVSILVDTAKTESITAPSTEPATETTLETEDMYAGLSEEHRSIRAIADAALTETYTVPAWEHFQIDIEYGVNGNTNIYIRYRLMIHGYRTDESYKVTLAADKTVQSVYGSRAGEYSCYLEIATAEAFRVAEQKIGQDGYLTIDSEGYLCLSKEEIINFGAAYPETDENGEVVEGAPTSGCGIDHEHVFYHERICPKP